MDTNTGVLRDRHVSTLPQRWVVIMMVLVLLCVVILIVGCKSHKNTADHGTSTSQPISSSTTNQIAALVRVWRDAGAARGLGDDTLNTGADILADAIAVTGKVPDDQFVLQFRASLPLFLDCHEAWLKDARFSESTCRWLAFCTAEALSRDALTQEQIAARTEEYRAFYKDCATYLEQRVRRQLPADAPAAVDSLISEGFAAWVDNAMKWTARLQETVLCPSLRGPISDDMRHIVQSKYTSDEQLPRWEEAPSVLQTREEWFIQQTGLLLKNSLSNAIFWVSLADMKPKVRVNRYWGHTGYGAMGGTGTVWPLCMRLHVKNEQNAKEGWKRSTDK